MQATPVDYERQLRANPQVLTTGRESLDLIIASFLFFLVFGLRPLITGTQSLESVLVLTIIVTPAFILHELGHKYSAIRFGKYARFSLLRQGVTMTLIFAFIGFPLAGPGATLIMRRSNIKEDGIIASSGIIVNVILAFSSFLASLVLPSIIVLGVNILSVLTLSILINCSLALFNLLPFMVLDGKKIYRWSLYVWFSLVIINMIGFVYGLSAMSVLNVII